MNKTIVAALFAVLLCVVGVYAIDWETTVDMEQKTGQGYGTIRYNDFELESNFYKVKLYTWYTLVDFKNKNNVLCLGSRQSGYLSKNKGKLAIGVDFEQTPGYTGFVNKPMLVLQKDVSCWNVDGKAIKGKMINWQPNQYLYPEE